MTQLTANMLAYISVIWLPLRVLTNYTQLSLQLHVSLSKSLISVNGRCFFNNSGNAPAIIAKGGFSGLFPDSSINAYSFVNASSSKDTILWCDVRLTKDGVGICLPDLKLDNCTDITYYYPNRRRTYWVNGVKTVGWFSVDYNFTDLAQVSCKY